MSPTPTRWTSLLSASVAVLTLAVTLGFSAAGATSRPVVSARPGRMADDPPEAQLFELVNDARARAGVAGVARDPYLDAYARRHAAAVAHAGQLFHSDLSSLLALYTAVAENVAYGGDAGAAHAAFLRSAPHHHNIVYPGYHRVGIGAQPSGGRLFAVYVFAD